MLFFISPAVSKYIHLHAGRTFSFLGTTKGSTHAMTKRLHLTLFIFTFVEGSSFVSSYFLRKTLTIRNRYMLRNGFGSDIRQQHLSIDNSSSLISLFGFRPNRIVEQPTRTSTHHCFLAYFLWIFLPSSSVTWDAVFTPRTPLLNACPSSAWKKVEFKRQN